MMMVPTRYDVQKQATVSLLYSATTGDVTALRRFHGQVQKKNYDHFDNDDDDTDDDIGNYENKFDIHFRATTWPCGIMTKGPQYIW